MKVETDYEEYSRFMAKYRLISIKKNLTKYMVMYEYVCIVINQDYKEFIEWENKLKTVFDDKEVVDHTIIGLASSLHNCINNIHCYIESFSNCHYDDTLAQYKNAISNIEDAISELLYIGKKYVKDCNDYDYLYSLKKIGDAYNDTLINFCKMEEIK